MPPKPAVKVLRFQINVIYSLVIINVLYLPVCPLSSLRKLLPLKFLLPTPTFFSYDLFSGVSSPKAGIRITEIPCPWPHKVLLEP